MAVIRAKNPLRWVRRALLLLGLMSTAAVALLFAAYRFGSAGRIEEAEVQEAGEAIDERTIAAGQGFDYTQTSEGERVFRIRAARNRQDRADWAFLEEVALEIYREDGHTTRVTSRRARVNQKTWAAELEGDVVLRGWEDLELRARGLELVEGGQQLTSIGAVEFDFPPPGQTLADEEAALPPLTGRAGSLRIDRRKDTVDLSGGVHVRNAENSEVPLRVDCERLLYRRDEGMMRLFEDVFLQYGEQQLQARTLSLLFYGASVEETSEPTESVAATTVDTEAAGTGAEVEAVEEPTSGLRMLRARWEVRGRLATGGDLSGSGLPGVGGVEFAGQYLEIEPNLDDSSLRRMRLEGDSSVAATVEVVDETGLTQRLIGDLLESYSIEDRLQIVEGVGMPLLLEEYLDVEPRYFLRQACAHKVRAQFLPGGQLGRIALERQVELRDENLYLSGGNHASLDLESGALDIRGPAVELFNQRGAITAPHFSYRRDKGILHADSGVQALLRGTETFADTPLGRSNEPVRIESQEATWTEIPQTFSFRGGVRAWQGQNLLLADQLRGDEEKQELAASGGVSTVWIDDNPASPASGAGGEPIEVRAKRLTYVPSATAGAATRTLIYRGGVQVKQGRRTILCRALSVVLAPGSTSGSGDKPRRMICRDDVLITDPVANREVRGDTAVFTVAEDRVEVFGDRVRLLDEQRNSLVGKYLVYDLAAGTVRLQSRTPDGGTQGSRAPSPK